VQLNFFPNCRIVWLRQQVGNSLACLAESKLQWAELEPKPSLGSGFDSGCRAPCRECVQWQQEMLWSPHEVPQLAEPVCPSAAGAAAILRRDILLAG